MSTSTNTFDEKSGPVWERVGPIASGGTVFGLAVSPVPDKRRYWAATGCGTFYSDDGGATWVQRLTGLTTPLLSSLAVAPNGALIAGALGGDLFASFDYGLHWETGFVPEELRATVTVVLASPNFAQDGTFFAATDGAGLLVSRNSGKQWEDSGFGLDDESVLALTATSDWSRRETMFAATSEGVFSSSNGGRAWRKTRLMLDDDVVDVLATSPNFDEDRTVYAGTEGGRLYRSTDGGRSWDMLHEKVSEGPLNCLWLVPDFGESRRLVAGAGSRILVSTDGGESWSASSDIPGTVLALAGDGEVILAGLHDVGVFKSTDGGVTWESSSSGLSARGFSQLIPADGSLYAMGPQEGVWRSANGGKSWGAIAGIMAHGPLSALAVPADKRPLVAGQEDGIVRPEGDDWKVVCDVPGIQALAVHPKEGIGWAGTIDGRLLATRDGGETWEEVSSPCEGQEVLSIVISPVFDVDRTVFMGTAIAAAEGKPARVALWRSTDAGETWRQVTSQTTNARWLDITMPMGVQEDVAQQAILATGPFCLRPLRRAKDVWISTRVDPEGANTLSVVAMGEIDSGGRVYAATGNGVYRSMDGGRTWQPFSEGLTVESFIAITAVPRDEGYTLYAMNLGGVVWRCEVE
jgi:photosystem II stability/assembly factor-like uncharacterized protein